MNYIREKFLSIGIHAFTFLAILIFSNGLATATPYFIWDDYGGTWHDASQEPFNAMCWAATAANALAYGNWGSSAFPDETAIFNEYTNYWSNKTGSVTNAWAWWLNGGDFSGMTQSGGGGYWPEDSWTDYYISATLYDGNVLASLNASLRAGYVPVLNARWNGWWGFGHGLTLWGVETNANGDYTGIWITDPLDYTTGLMYYSITQSGNQWFFPDGSKYDDFSSSRYPVTPCF